MEFGLCTENEQRKAYGAGLLSSFGELQVRIDLFIDSSRIHCLLKYCISDKPSIMPFDPFRASVQPYPITSYQPTYFLAESFKDAKEKLRYDTFAAAQFFTFSSNDLLFRQYAMTIPRPFGVHYNPYTQSIEVIDGKEQIVNMVRTLRSKNP